MAKSNFALKQSLNEVFKELKELRISVPAENHEHVDGKLDEIEVSLKKLESGLARIMQENLEIRESRVVYELSQMLAGTVSTREVLSTILDGLKDEVPYDSGGIFIIDSTGQIQAQVFRGYAIEQLESIKMKMDEGIVGWAIRHGKEVIVDDVNKDERYIISNPKTKSEMAVPIISDNDVIGCINLESNKKAAFTSKKIRFVNALASHAAVALDRANTHRIRVVTRQLERELQIARRIQVALLPKRSPKIEGYDIAGLNVPSRDIGGDYYDYIHITDNDLGLVIADVAGKGVPAGLIMSGLRAALRTKAETTYSMRHILTGVNKFLFESTGPEAFVTGFYAVLNIVEHKFTYVNAGHDAPLLFDKNGKVQKLETGGPLLGVFQKPEFEEATINLESGSLMVLYTDGIVEAGAPVKEEFGVKRLEELIYKLKDESARSIATEIEREASRWMAKSDAEMDDRTVIVVKRV